VYDFFPKNVSVVTVIVLGTDENGRVVAVNNFRLANSGVDVARRFALRDDGTPILGPRVYRERTRAELAADDLAGAEYLRTLAPLCNTGEPWLKLPGPAAA
jgi:hypothetical protein